MTKIIRKNAQMSQFFRAKYRKKQLSVEKISTYMIIEIQIKHVHILQENILSTN